jgi:uncharacterized delta-60 repeat protein
MRTVILTCLIGLCLILQGEFSTVLPLGSNPGALDETFLKSSLGFDGALDSLGFQSNGQLLLCGTFANFDGLARPRIVRLNQTGSVDETFKPAIIDGPLSARIASIEHYPGKILVWGDINKIGETLRRGIARLNEDGNLDVSFDPALDGTVFGVAIQPDEKLLVWGEFSHVQQIERKVIARLNRDGSLDSSFNAANLQLDKSLSLQVALDPTGKIIVLNGNRLMRVFADGAIDKQINLAPSKQFQFNGAAFVYAMVVQPDGKVLVGGDFDSVTGGLSYNLARFDSNLSRDYSFFANEQSSPNWVLGLYLPPQGDVVATRWNFVGNGNVITEDLGYSLERISNSGSARIAFRHSAFLSYRANTDGMQYVVAPNYVFRFDQSGLRDQLFRPVPGANDTIRTIALASNDQMYSGGHFSHFTGSAHRGIVRLFNNGAVDETFAADVEGAVYGIGINEQTPFDVTIGGKFTKVNGATRNGLAKLTTNGSLVMAFDPRLQASTFIKCMISQPDRYILAGGILSLAGQAEVRYLARFDENGRVDSGFKPLLNGSVEALRLVRDGKVLIGGAFTTVDGLARNGIARLLQDGLVDTEFRPGIGANGYVYAIALQEDGKIVVAGDFRQFDGRLRPRIARLNETGTLDTSFNPGTGSDNTIFALAVQPDGRIVIGGSFHTFNGFPRLYLARLEPNGSLDLSFNPTAQADAAVHNISLSSEGQIYLGGAFSEVNKIQRYFLARLYGLESPSKAIRFLSYSYSQLQFEARLDAPGTTSVVIESSPDLINWTRLTNFPSVGTNTLFTDSWSSPPRQRFYRAASGDGIGGGGAAPMAPINGRTLVVNITSGPLAGAKTTITFGTGSTFTASNTLSGNYTYSLAGNSANLTVDYTAPIQFLGDRDTFILTFTPGSGTSGTFTGTTRIKGTESPHSGTFQFQVAP